jgi:hypothetical protein
MELSEKQEFFNVIKNQLQNMGLIPYEDDETVLTAGIDQLMGACIYYQDVILLQLISIGEITKIKLTFEDTVIAYLSFELLRHGNAVNKDDLLFTLETPYCKVQTDINYFQITVENIVIDIFNP